jgi:hypothetical protein
MQKSRVKGTDLAPEGYARAQKYVQYFQMPKNAYGWLLRIYYKPDGTLDRQHTEALNEHLMPDDTVPVDQ